MTRHELREQTFLMLFGMDFHREDKREALEHYLDDTCEYELSEAEREEVIDRVLRIDAVREELDRRIDAVSQGWKTDRMGKPELNLLRLALFEMCYDEQVPVKVSINEAVELAKLYGEEDAPSFINGILARLVDAAGPKAAAR